ncbi:MAG: RraA family protein [Prosthecobacter sp.]|jgi:4-hydroxy-4-methyl-2-oxoglutarate aldolase|uniref:RraA family protein n=1 Tax=Prosthecobacter sp. TaxID=1965333 RepID=UPI0019E3DAE3|nr:RraA family protein [Prosthecobacter sp.]MBE2286034.1 RraA family protein [Prosthecobacter sp.]
MKPAIAPETLQALQKIDTCTVANAIETFNVRLRNEGYADSSIRCMTNCDSPVVGHAVTARIRCSSPPVTGGTFVDRTDWWDHILTIPGPRIVVIEDVDEAPGAGAFLGEVHACILHGLGCVAAITNGSVRDLPAINQGSFKLFANHVSVSHAYVHVVEFGTPVKIGGLEVRPGDLLHADCHGVLSVPHEIADRIPAAAAQITERERKVFELCRAGEVTVDKLRNAVRGVFD